MEDYVMKTTIIKTGRIIFAIPLLIFGIFHFMNGSAMSGMIPSYIPGGVFWAYLTGAGFIAASISILINVQTRLACFLLAGMLLVFILTIHLPGVFSTDQMKSMMSVSGLLKDLTIAAGAVVIAGLPSKKEKEK